MPSATELSLYDNAKHWVAQYASVDDVKEFIDKTAAIQEYARRANDFELEKKAAAARVRAERKCGELLKEREKSRGGRPSRNRSRQSTGSESPRTLRQLGITKDQSSSYQRLADIPEPQFEKSLDLATRAAGAQGRVTTSSVLAMQAPRSTGPRINEDALWLWGRLRDFEKNLLHQNLQGLLDAMTPVMRRDAERIVPKLKHWLR